MGLSSRRFEQGLLAFAWNQWGQLGVSAHVRAESTWCQDPEALIVFTLQLARRDPRQFDELLDWLVTNERDVSVRRLRALAADPEAGRLADAALSWVARHRPRTRLAATRATVTSTTPEPLFMRLPFPVRGADPEFLRAGFVRAALEPSGKSLALDPGRRVAFAFRLRRLLGVGVRAEIVRVMMTSNASGSSAQVLTMAAAYARRNVREALDALDDAGALHVVRRGSETRYSVDRRAWARVLGLRPEELPQHRDWAQLLPAALALLAWLEQREGDERSELLRAAAALDVLEELAPALAFAGIPVARAPNAETAEQELERAAVAVLAAIDDG